MKTYSVKPDHITRTWYLLDASEISLGRLSTKAATLLTGKAKTQFSHHIDCGDYVIIINAAELKVTGDKLNKKIYYHHSGYPGGLRSTTLKDKLKLDPVFVITHAVGGMLPINKLKDQRMKRLKVYAGTEHDHAAQQPRPVKLKGTL